MFYKVVYYSAWATIAKYQRLNGLNDGNMLSYSFGI
jgi:hypothetical protein